LSLNILDIALIATAILKLRVESGKKEYKKYSSFLLMGGTWFIVGLTLGVFYRGTGVFDSPLLSLGLIFLFAGGIGIITKYFKHQKIDVQT
jgi:hypothetical protein